MAEKFMTRRERREAERRQAAAAYDAQQAAKAEEAEAPAPDVPEPVALVPDTPAVDAPATAAPDTATLDTETPEPEVQEPEIRQSDAQESSSQESVAQEPEPQAPVIPAAPPRPTVEPDRVAASRPEPVLPDAAPAADLAPASDPAPAADPAPASDAAPVTEPPRFSSRSERKRFLREHDLPSDIATASIPIVLAQRASGTASAEADELAEAPRPAAAADAAETAEAAAPTDAVAPTEAADSTEAAGPASSPTASLFPTATPGASTAPQYDLASRRVDAHTTGPDFETSSTAVITPSALGDFDQPLKRRSPVVKPPTGSNIRVVTGALPIVTQQDLEANPPTTPMSAIDADALAADDRGTGTFRTSESPVFRASRPVSDPWAQLGDSAEEEEDSDELEEPPARPMSARSVTNEDGTVLVAERNSMVPFIVLGATGFAALVLVIVAITLLF